jgi:hypothetical protein
VRHRIFTAYEDNLRNRAIPLIDSARWAQTLSVNLPEGSGDGPNDGSDQPVPVGPRCVQCNDSLLTVTDRGKVCRECRNDFGFNYPAHA